MKFCPWKGGESIAHTVQLNSDFNFFKLHFHRLSHYIRISTLVLELLSDGYTSTTARIKLPTLMKSNNKTDLPLPQSLRPFT